MAVIAPSTHNISSVKLAQKVRESFLGCLKMMDDAGEPLQDVLYQWMRSEPLKTLGILSKFMTAEALTDMAQTASDNSAASRERLTAMVLDARERMQEGRVKPVIDIEPEDYVITPTEYEFLR